MDVTIDGVAHAGRGQQGFGRRGVKARSERRANGAAKQNPRILYHDRRRLDRADYGAP